jgi:hypothetical protein
MRELGRLMLVLTGVILLFPGACSIYYTPMGFLGLLFIGDADYGLIALAWPAGFALGALGIWILRRNVRR